MTRSRTLRGVLGRLAAAASSSSSSLAVEGPAALLPLGRSLAAGARPSLAAAAVAGLRGAQRRAYTEDVMGVHGNPYASELVEMKRPAPDFHANCVTAGEISTLHLSKECKGKWAVLLFYPKDFTYVCPTELIAFSDRSKEFEALGAQVIGISTDTEEVHLAWCNTPRKRGGLGHMNIPLVADPTLAISRAYGVLAEELGIAYRGLFLIDPAGAVRNIAVTDFPVGRSVDETLRLIQAYQFVEEHGEVCPADWTPGEATMKADAKGAQDYFQSANEGEDAEIASRVPSAKTPAELSAATAGPATVVDFYAPWCGKCQQIGPFVEKLMDANPGVKFVKVDVDDPAMAPVAKEMGVSALPAFHFFKGGKSAAAPITGYKKQALENAVKGL